MKYSYDQIDKKVAEITHLTFTELAEIILDLEIQASELEQEVESYRRAVCD